MENGHRNSWFTHEKWWFPIVMYTFTRQRVDVENGWEWWFSTPIMFVHARVLAKNNRWILLFHIIGGVLYPWFRWAGYSILEEGTMTIYICMYIYICRYIDIYIYVSIYIHMIYICIYIYIHMIYICVYIYTYDFILQILYRSSGVQLTSKIVAALKMHIYLHTGPYMYPNSWKGFNIWRQETWQCSRKTWRSSPKMKWCVSTKLLTRILGYRSSK